MDLLQALLKARADPLGRGPKGVTALHRAAMEGHEEVRGWLWGRSLSRAKVGWTRKRQSSDLETFCRWAEPECPIIRAHTLKQFCSQKNPFSKRA